MYGTCTQGEPVTPDKGWQANKSVGDRKFDVSSKGKETEGWKNQEMLPEVAFEKEDSGREMKMKA